MAVQITTPASRIIAALDMPLMSAGGFVHAMCFVGIKYFKVGYKLIHSIGGPEAIDMVTCRGGQVIYDAKLHDTKDTIGDTVAAIREKKPAGFMIHASSSGESLKRAVAEAGEMTIFGVTVPTDIDDNECQEIYGRSVKEQVSLLARRAEKFGLNALICSPLELAIDAVKSAKLMKATPGVRPVWAATGQQKRFTTPQQAFAQGADMIVIGSPLYNPPSEVGTPTNAAKLIIAEIEIGFSARAA